MKIVQVHNFYQISGGEDTVVCAEKVMLESKGHEVVQYVRHNNEIKSFSALQKLELLSNTSWSEKAMKLFALFLEANKPDICHVHNFFPLLSPAIFDVCFNANIPVVMTLHNYRLICSNGLFYRNGLVCEDCLTKSSYSSVLKKCYRNSVIQTYAVARMIEKNKKNKTWLQKVDAFICLTEFAQHKFKQAGIPQEKLNIKPNFVEIQLFPKTVDEAPYFVFVGRLSEEKGVKLLKEVSEQIPWRIKIIGEGDLLEYLSNSANIDCLGKLSPEHTLHYIRNAGGLILPSLWYEGMPMTILEAFSQKTTVVASNLGGIKSMVETGKNGLLFEPGSAQNMIEKLKYIIENPTASKVLAENGYRSYREKYSAESNYEQLLTIYKSLIPHSQ